MADPISITTGVLGLIQGSISVVRVLKSATVTPQELAQLEKELEHLSNVVEEIKTITNGGGHANDNLVKNMKAAEVRTEDIRDYIQTQIYKDSDLVSIRRTALIRERSKLRGFAREIETARLHLVDSLTILNLYFYTLV